MRKHPVIFGLAFVFLVGVALLILLYSLNALSGKGASFSGPEKVGIINIDGIISSSQEIVDQIDEFAKDNSVKAVVVRIDSPGGGVAASQEIYGALKGLKKNKKVIASLGSVAASGGYMIACAADKILANPGTLTGSISAIMFFGNAEELLKKIGFKASVIKSGKYKDIGSPTREMTADEKQILQVLVDDIYHQFVDLVSKDRNIPREKVVQVADGRLFSGRQALSLQLIDLLGDRGEAVRLAGKMGGIKGVPDVVYPKKKAISFWDLLLENNVDSFIGTIRDKIIALPRGVNLLYEYGV